MKRSRKLAWCAVALLVGLGGTELALRQALFRDSDWIRQRFWKLRRAELYYDPSSDDEYWILRRRLESETGEAQARQIHPTLGWIDPSIDPTTFVPEGTPAESDPRRRVLLYGSSFARCMTNGEYCFEGLLARSDLSDRFVLVNYGVRGYGIDQVYLLLEASFGNYAARKPIVVVGLEIDDDFDRSVLRLRGSPKPRLLLRGGELVGESEHVPAIDEFLHSHPLGATSYAWRGLVRGADCLPDALLAHDGVEAEKRALGAAILEHICAELRAADAEFFFVLFLGERSWHDPGASAWREPLALETLDAQDAPYVSSRVPLAEHAAEHGGSAAECFLHGEEADGHLSALGNEVVFAAIHAGLAGRFEARTPTIDPKTRR